MRLVNFISIVNCIRSEPPQVLHYRCVILNFPEQVLVFRWWGTLCCIKYINLVVVSCEEDVCVIPRGRNGVILLFNRSHALVDFQRAS